MVLQLKSPEATQVVSVAAADGASVGPGDLLMRLDDSRYQKYLAKLKEKEDTFRANLIHLSEAELANRRDILQKEAGSYKRQADELSQAHTNLRDNFENLKVVDYYTFLQSLEALSDAQESELKSTVALAQLDVDADISKRFISRALEFISSEQAYVQNKVSRLSIKAPVSGRLKLFVSEHAPVRRGFVLAELT